MASADGDRSADGAAAVRNPQGYATLTDIQSGKTIAECDTFKCQHCQRVVHVKAKANPDKLGGWCRQCAKAICPKCVATGRCEPFEKKLEAEEARYHARRSYGLA